MAGAQAPALKTNNIMEQKKEDKERTRKAYAKKGERSQRIMSFRLDIELTEWLEQQANKGRYINNLINQDRIRCEKK